MNGWKQRSKWGYNGKGVTRGIGFIPLKDMWLWVGTLVLSNRSSKLDPEWILCWSWVHAMIELIPHGCSYETTFIEVDLIWALVDANSQLVSRFMNPTANLKPISSIFSLMDATNQLVPFEFKPLDGHIQLSNSLQIFPIRPSKDTESKLISSNLTPNGWFPSKM